MNIGETIYRLRSEKNMSQGDLADMLDVSRQSVSKWETNQSVPDLDKIIKLSKIFGVTIDEFVLGETQEAAAAVAGMPAGQQEPGKVVILKETVTEGTKWQKIEGIILLCMSFVVMLAFAALRGGILEGIILALPFLICGFICMLAKRNAGLWCAWAVYFLIDSYTLWAVGVNSWIGALRMLIYGGKFTVGGIVSLIQFAFMLVLTVITVLRFKDKYLNISKGMLVLIIAGWIILLITLPLEIMLFKVYYGKMIAVMVKLFDWFVLVLFIVLAVFTVRFIKSRRKEENA